MPSRRTGRPGYYLKYAIDPRPTQEEIERYAGQGLVIRSGPSNGLETVARLGSVALQLVDVSSWNSPSGECVPLLALKRETIGIDTEVTMRAPYLETLPPRLSLPERPTRHASVESRGSLPHANRAAKFRPRGSHPHDLQSLLARMGVNAARQLCSRRGLGPVVIGVIDSEFSVEGFDAKVMPVEDVWLTCENRRRLPGPGAHGDLMVAILREVLAGTQFQIRRLRLPPGVPALGGASSYLLPTYLAIALAMAVDPCGNAVDRPPADIVLIAMSSGEWGTPPQLDATLRAAGKEGREGRGTLVVCSTGRPSDNRQPVAENYLSAALGADEVAAHPDALAVGPCDLRGRWLRRLEGRTTRVRPADAHGVAAIAGRMGPSVEVVAPGVFTALPGDGAAADESGTVDESSMASALVAGVAGLILQSSPNLSSQDVRLLLRETAWVPLHVDMLEGPEATTLSRFDRSGHSFKVGAGMVNALGAVLSARDPLCQAFIRAAPPSSPPEQGMLFADFSLHVAAFFDTWLDDPTIAGGKLDLGDELALGYLHHRSDIARQLLRSFELRHQMDWLARHLRAILAYDGTSDWFSPTDGGTANHGVLRRRLVRLVESLREEAVGPDSLVSWLELAQSALKGATDRDIESTIGEALSGILLDR